MDSETLEIVRAFVAESLDSLNEQEEKIKVLASGNAKENINSIFRVFHTIKGLSGFLGFNVISTVAQEVEVLLDVLRKKPMAVSATSVALIKESFSLVKMLLTTVGAEVKDSGHGEAVRNHIGKLKEAIMVIKSDAEIVTSSVNDSLPTSGDNAALTTPSSVSASASQIASSGITSDNVPEKVSSVPKLQAFKAEVRGNVIIDEPQGTSSLSSKQTEDVQEYAPKVTAPDNSLQRFISESLDHISIIEQGCRRLEQNPHDMTVIGAILGSVLRLKAGSRSMGFVEIETKSIDIEAILDAIRRNTLTVYPGLISMVLNILASITTLIQSLAARQALKTQKENAQRAVKLPTPSVATSGVFAPIPLPNSYSVKSPSVAKNEAQSGTLPAQRRDAIVDADRLEKLFELVGELVAIETMVTKNPDIVGLELTRFNKAAEMLHNVTAELENTVLALRQRTS
ncbi:MAG: Hpt domain-containing protein [Ignavibacteria bacterium]|nr:Hpt domain-containing protein [Ignavibacteria bacterium]